MRTVIVVFLLAACDDSGSTPPQPSGPNDPATPASPAIDTPDLAQPARLTKVSINFDDVRSGTTITNQYSAHAVFSTDPGLSCTAYDSINIGQSQPNYMSAGTDYDLMHPLYVDFMRPVQNLRFNALGVTNRGTVAHIRVLAGSQLLSTLDLVGQGNDYQPVPVDLTAFSGVTRIEVVDITDAYGFDYDDFSFDFFE